MQLSRSFEQHACCYWFTGLSGAGKSTLSTYFHAALLKQGYRALVLDGDELRGGLNKDLGFSRQDRAENTRRIAEVAHLMTKAGLIVLVSAISPYAEDRQAARNLFSDDEFFEVFVDTSLTTCMTRDPKGLYQRAKDGLISQLTGVDDPYESPTSAELVLATEQTPLDTCIDALLQHYAAQQKIALNTHPVSSIQQELADNQDSTRADTTQVLDTNQASATASSHLRTC